MLLIFSVELAWQEEYCILLKRLSGQKENEKGEDIIAENLK